MKFKYKLVAIITIMLFSASCTKEEDNINNDSTISITGEWDCHDNESENGIYGARNFTIDIDKNDSYFVIYNYAALGINASANFNSNSNSFTVEQQTVDGFLTHGSGTFSSDSKTATFTYYLDDEKITSTWNR